MRTTAIVGALALVGGGVARADTFTETFTNGVNQGGWTFGYPPGQSFPAAGGNPEWYFRVAGLDTTVPLLHTTSSAFSPVFVGNYRSRNVTQITADVNVFATNFPIGPFPLTVMLYSNNGTPGNFDDDWGAYLLGDSIPAPGTGWKHIAFAIPSQAAALPAGWEFIQFGPSSPPNPDWNLLITNVNNLFLSYGDPSLVYIFQMWTAGVDNISITTTPVCYPDCTGEGSLTIADFGCFQTKFVAGDPYADCNGVGGLTIADFGCFQTAFVAGCP